jgi:hypothetical protein
MENKLTLEHYLDAFKYKTPCRITQLGIFNLDLEYPDSKYYEIGVIEDLSTYESGKSISGSLRLKNGISFDFDFKIDEESEIEFLMRPTSDLTKFCEYLGFVPLDVLADLFGYGCLDFDVNNILNQPYKQIQQLLKWHFDIHGLIEKGLAIDFNQLNK